MEKRMKHQRNRLIWRVTLIMLAAWLLVSAAFGVLRLNTQKEDWQKKMLGHISTVQYSVSYGSMSGAGINALNYYLLGSATIYSEDHEADTSTQLMITKGKEILANTAGKCAVTFSTLQRGSTIMQYGYLDRENFLSSMTEEQREKIEGYLRQSQDYRLVCTQYYYAFTNEIIPRQVQIVTVENENDWNVSDTVVETFRLNPSTSRYDAEMKADWSVGPLLERDQTYRNEIDRGFVLNEPADLLATITENDFLESAENGEMMIRTGLFDYVLLTRTPINYLMHEIRDEVDLDNPDESVMTGEYAMLVLTYARPVNLLGWCGRDLLLGTGLLFAFFAVVGTLLILLLYTLLRQQYEQEKKRVSLTNALAHDIKTPLFVIGGYAQNLCEHVNTDKQEHYAQMILAQTDHVNTLVHRMLDLSRLDAADLQLNRTDFDLADLLDEVIADFAPRKAIRFSRGEGAVMNADRVWMKSALENLIDNAVRYSPPDGEVAVTLSGKTLRIDNPRDTTVTNADSSGIGLSIVRAVLDLHGFRHKMTLTDDHARYDIIW